MAFTRRPGVGDARRGGFRGVGGASNIIIDVMSSGTFARTDAVTCATYQTSATTIAQAVANQRRLADFGTGGRGLLVEPARTNAYAANPLVHTAAGGWSLVNTSGGASYDGVHATIKSPLGGDAHQYTFGANASDYLVDYSWSSAASTAFTATAWIYWLSGATNLRQVIKHNTNNTSGNLAISGAWTRIRYTVTTQTGAASSPFCGLRNSTAGTAVTFLVAGMQVEAGAFPTSLITSAGATRAEDDLTLASLPPAMLTVPWAFDHWPLMTSAEIGSARRMIDSGGAADDSLGFSATPNLQFTAGGVAGYDAAVTWAARLQKLSHIVRMAANTMDATGYSTGGGTGLSIGAADWTIDDSSPFRIGGTHGGGGVAAGVYGSILRAA